MKAEKIGIAKGSATAFFIVVSLVVVVWALPLRTAGAAGIVRTIPSGGTVTLGASSIGSGAIQVPEIDPGLESLGEPDLPGADAAVARVGSLDAVSSRR